jgi:carbonic anhydrase
MCEHSVDAANMRAIERRSVLKLAAMGAGLVLADRAIAQDAKAPPKPENVLSPDDALKRLMEGNAR